MNESRENVFNTELAYLLAQGAVTIKKVGTTFVLQGKKDRVSLPESAFPSLSIYKKIKSKKI